MSKEFSGLRKIVHKLRKECPWDREQTVESLIKDLISESREVEQAIKKKDYANLRDEIGDVILVAMMIAQICEEEGKFKIEDSLKDVSAKMKRRHPHVFGNAIAKTPEDALKLFYDAKKRKKMKLYFTTTNKGKYEEGKEVLSKYGIELIHINATKPEDKEKPIEQIAIEGAELLSKKYNKPLIVEDTGVFFKAYTNFPGPNAKLTFNQLGYKGIFKVLKGEDKRAYMKTALAYCEPGKKAKLFEGIVTGKITTKVYPPIDKHLPYDPIFIPDGFKKAFSLLPEIKGKVSHRVLAFEKLGRWLN